MGQFGDYDNLMEIFIMTRPWTIATPAGSMSTAMVAWHVFSGDPNESSLLVFAPTAARARYMAWKQGLWDYGDYIDTRARRAPQWDAYANREWVAEKNEDLPSGAEPFYEDYEF